MTYDPRLRQVLAERYGDPGDVAAEQSAPPPAPAPRPVSPSDDPQEHRRVLLDALRPKARAA
ncbi:hypothetical protein M3G91_15410 [Micromonospora chalcea]|uniref:hypothetical protein n=1 Tax=Micromonospora chalcea TaxID=1874 RepID=UPI0021A837BD|nr:hypothetical protein [Micromonospora chalcea]MCT2279009.1 hypothetical protein [Micromonospora chalcea]